MKPLEKLVRPNIWELAPCDSSARYASEGKKDLVLLDANECPYNPQYNRYPDPMQIKVKEKLSRIKGVAVEKMYLGNGCDEIIDLIYRCFCRPGVDNVVAIEPTYDRYEFFSGINDVEYRRVSLDSNFQIAADVLLAACDNNTKLVWICSPNNPTGNRINDAEIEKIINNFDGVVVVDEAYSDFSKARTWRSRLSTYPNIIVLNTMSNAWGCAAIRLGMAFADKEIIKVFNKTKCKYNINEFTQDTAIQRLEDSFEVEKWTRTIVNERDRMVPAFRQLPICERVYHTDANFFLAKVTDAQKVYKYLFDRGIIVRNCSNVQLCYNCLRITIGSKIENNELLAALRQY